METISVSPPIIDLQTERGDVRNDIAGRGAEAGDIVLKVTDFIPDNSCLPLGLRRMVRDYLLPPRPLQALPFRSLLPRHVSPMPAKGSPPSRLS